MSNLYSLDISKLHYVSNIEEINYILKGGVEEFFLINPPKSIYYLGVHYIKALADYAYDEFSYNYENFIIDVDQDSGLAQESMYLGFKKIIYLGPVLRKLEDIALQYGSSIIAKSL